jgi:LPXTG-motif cell wall-anchored protein
MYKRVLLALVVATLGIGAMANVAHADQECRFTQDTEGNVESSPVVCITTTTSTIPPTTSTSTTVKPTTTTSTTTAPATTTPASSTPASSTTATVLGIQLQAVTTVASSTVLAHTGSNTWALIALGGLLAAVGGAGIWFNRRLAKA